MPRPKYAPQWGGSSPPTTPAAPTRWCAPLPAGDPAGLASPWRWTEPALGGGASLGERLVYLCAGEGVAEFDRATKKEVWRLPTKRDPYPSAVLEPGGGLALVQIGSAVPQTLLAALPGRLGPLPMANLGQASTDQRLAAMALLHCYGDGYYRPQLQKRADRLRGRDPQSAGVIDKLLSTWPAQRDRRRLLEGCVASLLGDAAGDPLRGVGDPGAHRVLVWCLLQEFVYGSPTDGYSSQGTNFAYTGFEERPVPLSGVAKARLAAHCRQAVADGAGAEKPFAASILVSSGVGWAGLSDLERKGLFLSPHAPVWRWAAVALAKNGRRNQLVEWAGARPPGDHLDILWVLKRDKPKAWDAAELALWAGVAARDPGGVATALGRLDGPAPVEFRAPIRALVGRETAAPTFQDGNAPQADGFFSAVLALDAWQDPADVPLLLACLKHPLRGEFWRLDGEESKKFYEYRLRGYVKVMLQKRGVAVPPGLVDEEPAPPTP